MRHVLRTTLGMFMVLVACASSAGAQTAATPVELLKLIQAWKSEATQWKEAHGRLPLSTSGLSKQPGELTAAVAKQLSGNMGIGKKDPSLEAFLKLRLLKQFQPDWSKVDKDQLFQIIDNMPKPIALPQPSSTESRRLDAAIASAVPQTTLENSIKPIVNKLNRAQDVARAKNDAVFKFRHELALGLPREHGARLYAMILNARDRYEAVEWPRRMTSNPIATIETEAKAMLTASIEADVSTRQKMFAAIDAIRDLMPAKGRPASAHKWTIEGAQVKAHIQTNEVFKLDKDNEGRRKKLVQYIVEQRL